MPDAIKKKKKVTPMTPYAELLPAMVAGHFPLILVVLALVVVHVLAYLGQGFLAWVSGGLLLMAAWHAHGADPVLLNAVFGIYAALVVVFGVPPLRRLLVSSWAMALTAKTLPTIGDTERIALEAGNVWWEGEVFSGKPDWSKLTNFKVRGLSAEEQAFLTDEVEGLCDMLDDEEIAQLRDLPKPVWDFIKAKKFFGMIIPKEYGGLGFSAAMHSAVVSKVASRSVTAAVTVMVPNSLGPGELLLRYGTDDQKNYYLPRLANGTDIPCFALTEPNAGSDAASGISQGVVVKAKVGGKEGLAIKLTFNKRYITLAPVASVIGLAFRLYDPDHLLGDKKDIGITCALLPRDTKGLMIGNRHDPSGVPFMNGPLWGTDVIVPMDVIIGGPAQAGNGWRMLMECLAAGRGISLPSLSVGASQLSIRAASAYGLVREQFGMPIGKFEGIRERLARMAGKAYLMDATRRMTCGAVDAGEHASVASAIAKAYLTEDMREALNDGMDIFGGAAICRGDRNIFTRAYYSIPVGITVEGANILTRSLIVFGQGAVRCHPFVQDEVNAIQAGNVKAFDRAFFGHINHIIRNKARAFVLALTGARLTHVPNNPYSHYYRRIARLSAAFAFAADVALVTLGGSLKRKEYLSGRYADAFAHLFIATCTLKRVHDAGYASSHKPLVDWALTHSLYNVEQALLGVLDNLPNRFAAFVLGWTIFPLGARLKPPTDRHNDAVVDAVLENNSLRDELTNGIYIPPSDVAGLGALEDTRRKVIASYPARKKLMALAKAKQIGRGTLPEMAAAAVKAGLMTAHEGGDVIVAEDARNDVVQVNHFAPKVFNTIK